MVNNSSWNNPILILKYPIACVEGNKPTWLSMIKDELIHTDGVVVSMLSQISGSMSFLSALSKIVDTLLEQRLIQHTQWLIPRVKKAVSL